VLSHAEVISPLLERTKAAPGERLAKKLFIIGVADALAKYHHPGLCILEVVSAQHLHRDSK
jgi:hypothetical protein